MREVSSSMREGVESALSSTSFLSFVGAEKVELLVKWYVGVFITLMHGGGRSRLLFCRGGFDRVTVGGESSFGEEYDPRWDDDKYDDVLNEAACGVGSECAGESTILCSGHKYITWLLYR